jgi:hypothetical protein
MGTFAVYYLLVKYLREENFNRLLNSCSLIAIGSVLVIVGYLTGVLPFPAGMNPFISLHVGEEGIAPRLAIPNTFFLFFPYFLSIAPLTQRAGSLPLRDRITSSVVIVGSLLALFRMYLFIVVFGGILAYLRRGQMVRRVVFALLTLLFLGTVAVALDKVSGYNILSSVFERSSGAGEELYYAEGSGGSRIERNLSGLSRFSSPGIVLFGSVFSTEFGEWVQFVSYDLGIVATFLFFGLPGVMLVGAIYRRGLPATWNERLKSRAHGRAANALFLFLVAGIPAFLFMYNPLQSEVWIATFAAFLGSYDGLRTSNAR